MIKLFGAIDVLIAGVMAVAVLGFWSSYGLLIVALVLVKSVPFLPDIASMIDVLGAIIASLAMFGITGFFTWIAVIWFFQKGFISLISAD